MPLEAGRRVKRNALGNPAVGRPFACAGNQARNAIPVDRHGEGQPHAAVGKPLHVGDIRVHAEVRRKSQLAGQLVAYQVELGVRYFAGEIEVPGTKQVQLGREIRDGVMADPIDGDGGGVPVAGISLQFDPLAGHVADEPEGSVSGARIQARGVRMHG